MTTAPDDFYDEPDDGQPDDAQAKRDAFQRRKEAKEARDAELAELRAFKAQAERRDALEKARSEMKAEGPLDLFLRSYTGEPTSDAIKAAIATDPAVSGLITFVPDVRDVAAAEQAANATKLAGGSATTGQITPKDAGSWDEDRQRQFRKAHPEQWDTLLRNEPVTAPVGWA